MSKRAEEANFSKEAVRFIVGFIFVAAVVVAAGVGIPSKEGVRELPAVALGQAAIYRLEIFLLVFYGGLLIATPLFRGLIGGNLPIEISARGAKFAEETADSIEETKRLVLNVRQGLASTEAKIVRARLNIDQLAKKTSTTLQD
jgi:hypothetical protein